MKETRIMRVFERYIKKFDMNKGNVKAMYFHSIRMMELCKNIASNLDMFTEEEVVVCGLIGLFHDIGRFSNKYKNSFAFEDSADKSRESIEILFETDKLIEKITDNRDYDEIVKVAIYCQNKNGLPRGFDTKVLHFCTVVKDAHVIENFRMVTNYPYMNMNIDTLPNSMIYNDFKKYRVISAKVTDSEADKILEIMSLVFGMHYSYSYKLLKDEECVDKLVSSLKITNKGISKFFLQISSVLKVYIERKIGG